MANVFTMGAPVVHVVDDEEQRCCQFFLTDALGTVRDVVDDTGAVIQSYEFNEHGIPMPGSGASSGTFSPKTYQGGLSVNDDRNDSGLYLMGHRHYAAELGRFISRDPIGFRGGLNLFNGAGTSPVSMVDPSGLDVAVVISGPLESGDSSSSAAPGSYQHGGSSEGSGAFSGSGGNPFGHSAVAVTGGGTYSYFTKDKLGVDLATYLKGQVEKRDVRVYIIPTTKDQDAALLKSLNRCAVLPTSKVRYFGGDTCSGRNWLALVGAHIIKPSYVLDTNTDPYERRGNIPGLPSGLEYEINVNFPDLKPIVIPKGAAPWDYKWRFTNY